MQNRTQYCSLESRQASFFYLFFIRKGFQLEVWVKCPSIHPWKRKFGWNFRWSSSNNLYPVSVWNMCRPKCGVCWRWHICLFIICWKAFSDGCGYSTLMRVQLCVVSVYRNLRMVLHSFVLNWSLQTHWTVAGCCLPVKHFHCYLVTMKVYSTIIL